MRMNVLGPLEIVAADRRISLASRRQRVILAVLIARRGVVSSDRLIEAVWGAQPPPSARKSLHSHASRLRAALAGLDPGGANVVSTHADGYRLDPEHCEVP